VTDQFSIRCGPGDASGKRLVVATFGKREHRDRLDCDDSYRRGKFCQEAIRKCGLEDLAEIREDIEARLIRGADAEDAANEGQSATRPEIVRLSDVQPEPVDWLWPGRIATINGSRSQSVRSCY
jgi:hypothetical protein